MPCNGWLCPCVQISEYFFTQPVITEAVLVADHNQYMSVTQTGLVRDVALNKGLYTKSH